MKSITRLAALAAVLSLAACGHAASPVGPAAHAAAAKPATCAQQYATWKHGPARRAIKRIEAGLKSVSAAGAADDIPLMAAGLKRAARAAKAAQSHPLPGCADPAGYYGQFLARIRAAGDNAGSAGGLGSLLLAEVPLKGLPGVERKLGAELKRTGAKT